MEYLLGKEIALKIKERVKLEVEQLVIKPKYVVLVNKEDASSIGYVKNQEKNAISLGIDFESILMEQDEDSYINKINELNLDNRVSAIMVTRPLKKGLNEEHILSTINPKKDVDSMNYASLGELFISKKDYVAPATAQAIIDIIEGNNISLEGKNVLVIGRSISVGKPVAMMLLERNATVTIAHSRTKDLNSLLKNYDIIVVAIGKPEIIDSSLVNKDAIIIDAGIHYLDDGKIVGDVKVSDTPKYISKVPGGVGTITSAVLMENILKLYKKQG